MNTNTGRILKNTLGSHGYLHVGSSKNGKVRTHCIHVMVAQAWVSKPEDKKCVDHIDGNKTNNHHANLRYATHSENGGNMKKRSDASSIYKGVAWDRGANKWRAQITYARKNNFLEVFTSEREAAESYNAAAVVFYKEFAKLNELD